MPEHDKVYLSQSNRPTKKGLSKRYIISLILVKIQDCQLSILLVNFLIVVNAVLIIINNNTNRHFWIFQNLSEVHLVRK